MKIPKLFWNISQYFSIHTPLRIFLPPLQINLPLHTLRPCQPKHFTNSFFPPHRYLKLPTIFFCSHKRYHSVLPSLNFSFSFSWFFFCSSNASVTSAVYPQRGVDRSGEFPRPTAIARNDPCGFHWREIRDVYTLVSYPPLRMAAYTLSVIPPSPGKLAFDPAHATEMERFYGEPCVRG